jgi:hypothetical protein
MILIMFLVWMARPGRGTIIMHVTKAYSLDHAAEGW